MRHRLLALFVLSMACWCADTRLSITQLKEFVRSSVKMRYDDRKVAEYLRKVKLTHRLDDRTIEELQGLGAGPGRTVARAQRPARRLRFTARGPAAGGQVHLCSAPAARFHRAEARAGRSQRVRRQLLGAHGRTSSAPR